MVIELNRDLALAKQHFEDLTRLTTIASLVCGEYGTGPKRQQIRELLAGMVNLLESINKGFSSQLDNTDAPVMQLTLGLKEFYTRELEPISQKLRDIWFDITGLAELKALLEGLNPPPGKNPMPTQ